MRRAAGAAIPAFLVVVTALVVLSYLSFRGSFRPRSERRDPTPTDVDSTPVGALRYPIDTLTAPGASVGSHIDSLRTVLRPVFLGELAAIAPRRTLREALPELRPYWLEFTGGRMRVDIGGQLVGQDVLDRVLVRHVAQLRLTFEPVEPYWVLRVDFR